MSKDDIIKKLQEQIARKEVIEDAIYDISVNFSRDPNIDDAISLALHYLVDIKKVDRAYLMVLDNNYLSVKYECCGDGVMPIISIVQNIPYQEKHWFKKEQIANGYIAISDIEAIPPEGTTEKIFLQSRNVRSTLFKSFVYNNAFKGFLCVEHSSPIEWEIEYIQMLTLSVVLIEQSLERKNSEQQLIIAKEKAEQSDSLKTAFIANVSHEIRTPLNAIVGFAKLVCSRDLDLEKKTNYFRIIENNAAQLTTVIGNIMDIAQIESRSITVSYDYFALEPFLNDLVMQHIELLQDRVIDVTLRMPDEYPKIIYGDVVRIKQVLDNLLKNAIKYTKIGTITISFEVNASKKTITFTVNDTGIGIGEEFFETIFDAFSQVDVSLTRRYGGSGLGLAISRQLARIMKGDIWVDSELNKGSTFYFELPYCRD